MEEIVVQLHSMRTEHRKLDDDIIVISQNPHVDRLMIQRLKRRKLWLKDMIVKLESRLIPDLDA